MDEFEQDAAQRAPDQSTQHPLPDLALTDSTLRQTDQESKDPPTESPAEVARACSLKQKFAQGQADRVGILFQQRRGCARVGSHSGPGAAEGNIPGKLMGAEAPAFGTPVGKLALARFGFGTIVDNNNVSSSRVPIELGAPKSGSIGALRTNSRDLGSVDLIQATRAIANASQVLSAVMTAEQSRNSRAKAAMGLIK